MNTEENYIQKAWGDSEDDITIEEVKEAISEIQGIDEEHATFWVGIFDEDEFVLEVDKNLNLIGAFDSDSDEQLTYKAKNWEEVESLYNLFLDGNLEEVKKIMMKK